MLLLKTKTPLRRRKSCASRGLERTPGNPSVAVNVVSGTDRHLHATVHGSILYSVTVDVVLNDGRYHVYAWCDIECAAPHKTVFGLRKAFSGCENRSLIPKTVFELRNPFSASENRFRSAKSILCFRKSFSVREIRSLSPKIVFGLRNPSLSPKSVFDP